jgi:hypothetical protein
VPVVSPQGVEQQVQGVLGPLEYLEEIPTVALQVPGDASDGIDTTGCSRMRRTSASLMPAEARLM